MVEFLKTFRNKPVLKLWLGTRPIIIFLKAEFVEVYKKIFKLLSFMNKKKFSFCLIAQNTATKLRNMFTCTIG